MPALAYLQEMKASPMHVTSPFHSYTVWLCDPVCGIVPPGSSSGSH